MSGFSSALTAETVGKAIADIAIGDVGSSAFFFQVSGNVRTLPGALVAGSDLRYASAFTNSASTGTYGYSGVAPAGTWKVAGSQQYLNGANSGSIATGYSGTVLVRVA
jgi:hypothetical protein